MDRCIACEHLIGEHFQSVDGKVRCLHDDSGVSTGGILGVPYIDRCDCVDYRSEKTERRKAAQEKERQESEAAMQAIVDEIMR